ncbi:unnamed protein product [Nesidiocoris tenuis]|uniref:ubiquitinyl hydrolase 1 n=1 Tax=Nesidiocoris tenuis TaxID=355587 RepID=A0A6H5HG59_9HEMI|nr:unnamed protein product [Nesidiocoris tenuis]
MKNTAKGIQTEMGNPYAAAAGTGYVTEKLYMLVQLYLQNKGWNQVELLQYLSESKDGSMLPSASYLQMMASRIGLDNQGRLILRENGKIILPFEHFANAVMLKHMNGPHGLHLGLEATLRAVMESYTMGRENFGMEKEFIVEVVSNCPNAACRYYKSQLDIHPPPQQQKNLPSSYMQEASGSMSSAVEQLRPQNLQQQSQAQQSLQQPSMTSHDVDQLSMSGKGTPSSNAQQQLLQQQQQQHKFSDFLKTSIENLESLTNANKENGRDDRSGQEGRIAAVRASARILDSAAAPVHEELRRGSPISNRNFQMRFSQFNTCVEWSTLAINASIDRTMTIVTSSIAIECCCRSNISSTVSRCWPFFSRRSVDLSTSPTVELPWSDTEEPPRVLEEWQQQPQQYEGQPSSVVDTGGGGEVYPMPVPVATTMQQLYHTPVVQPMQNVTYVSGLQPHPGYHPGHPGMPQPSPYGPGGLQPMYQPPGRPRVSKPSPKRSGMRDAAGGTATGAYPPNVAPTAYGPPHPPSFPPPPLHPFQYSGTPTYPTAQHATGPPLYIQPVHMYHHHPHAPPMYHNYAPVYSPIPQPPPEEMMPHVEAVKVDPAPVVPYVGGQKLPRAQSRPQLVHEEALSSAETSSTLEPSSPSSAGTAPKADELVTPPRIQRLVPESQESPPKLEKSSPEQPTASPVATGAPADATAQPGNQPAESTSPAPVPANVSPALPVKVSQPPSKDAIITTLPPAKRKVPQAPANDKPTAASAPIQAEHSPTQIPSSPPVETIPEEQPQQKSTWASLFKSSDSGVASDPGTTERRAFKPPQNAILSAPPAAVKAPGQFHVDQHSSKDEAADPTLKALGKKLSDYKLEHKGIILKPRGLTNPSNYCYINATLQALIACPAFYNLIKLIADVKSAFNKDANKESKTPIIDSMVNFIREFQQSPQSWFKRVDKAQARRDSADTDIMTDPPFEPASIHKVLRKLRSDSSFHEEGRQEDAEEFLSFLLNGLNDEMLELLKLVSDDNPAPVLNGEVTPNGDSHIAEEPLWKSSSSVNEALEKLAEGTYIEGDSSHSTFRQSQTLDALPCVLILHLKCFHYRQRVVSKVKKALSFPVDLKLDKTRCPACSKVARCPESLCQLDAHGKISNARTDAQIQISDAHRGMGQATGCSEANLACIWMSSVLRQLGRCSNFEDS